MIEIPVYAPNTYEADAAIALKHIAPRSAIVGKPETHVREPYITIYYEGNKYGAGNMVTFADRAMFAYWRMRDRYPTVAMMAAPRAALLRIGTLYPEHGRIEPRDARDLLELARWLGMRSDGLHSELRCEGVRV